MLDIFLLGIQKTENFPENTNAPPALPIGNASALRASRGVHNNAINTDKIYSINIVTYCNLYQSICRQTRSYAAHFLVRYTENWKLPRKYKCGNNSALRASRGGVDKNVIGSGPGPPFVFLNILTKYLLSLSKTKLCLVQYYQHCFSNCDGVVY